MADNSALRAEASNPTTDPARLAAIAHEDPSLGAVVAANPAAYDGLLDWLLQYGDDAAKRAVGVRRGGPAAATVVAPPVAPAVAPAALGVPSSAAPAAPAAARKPLSPTLKKGLLFGGIGLAAIAVIAIAVTLISSVLGGGGSGSRIQVADIGSEPRDDAWSVVNPMIEADGLDDDDVLHGNAATVAQDRALVQWTAVDDSGDDTGEPQMSLLDTRNGNLLWSVEWEEEFTVVSAPGATPYVISTFEDDFSVLYSIDPSNGDVISDSESLDVLSHYSTSFGGAPLPGLNGDLLLLTEDGIGRYGANDFDEEKWFIDIDLEDDGYPSVAGNRVIIGDTAYSVDNGEEVDWDGDDDLRYVDLNGKILGQDSLDDDASLYLFSASGEEQWEYELNSASVVFAEGDTLILGNEDDETLISLDLSNGEERWSVDLESAEGYGAVGTLDAGVLIVKTSDDEAVAIEISSGDELYDFEVSDDGDWPITIIGMTKNVFYTTGNEDGDLIAYSTRSGDEVWTLDNPDEYSYVLLGGNIVGAQQSTVEDSEDDPVMIGIQP